MVDENFSQIARDFQVCDVAAERAATVSKFPILRA